MDAHCFYCGTWVKNIYVYECAGHPLCGGCIEWLCNDAKNPEGLPPQPDRRTIKCDYLKRLFRQKDYSKHVDWRNVAECLHDWWEPGRRRWWRWWRGLRKRTSGGGGGGGGAGYKRRRRGRGGFPAVAGQPGAVN